MKMLESIGTVHKHTNTHYNLIDNKRAFLCFICDVYER